MSDDFPDSWDDSRTTTSFEEWLDQHAESQGISKQELFEQLVSSYWTLNEMVQLLDNSGSDTSLADIYSESGDSGDVGTAPTVGGTGSDADEDAERSRKRDREDADRTGREGERRPRRGGDRIAELRDRVEDIESQLDAEQERGQSQDGMIEALADRLSALEADLEEVAAESEAGYESLSAEVESLSGRIDELDADLSTERETRAEQYEALADEQRRLDRRQESLSEGQERIREWLDTEFDSLQTILEHLISRGDDLDARLSQSEARYEDQIAALRAEREKLRSLKREAAAHGVHEGECGDCGATIDLDLLSEPYCPDCDASLTGIEVQSKWLFLSDAHVTTEGSADGDGRSGQSDSPSDPPPRGPAAETGGAHRSGAPNGRRQHRSAATERERSAGETSPEPDRQGDAGTTDGGGGTDPSPGDDPATRAGNATGSSESSFDFGDIEETAPDPVADESSDGGSGEESGPRTRMQIGTPAGEADDGSDADKSEGVDDGSDADENERADDPLEAPFGDLDDLRRNETADADE